MAHDPVLIIKRLADLSAGLSTGNDGGKARAEALRLSNQLTASLQQPENVAVDLLFSVSHDLLWRSTWRSMVRSERAHRLTTVTASPGGRGPHCD